jgi:hypothetical protein
VWLTDAVCATVGVDDWSRHCPGNAIAITKVTAMFHGANFGVSAKRYLPAGGFRAFAVQEDVSLVAAARTGRPGSVTSTRLQDG